MLHSRVGSSSRGVFPSDLHSYSKRRFIRPLVSLSLRQWEVLVGFLRKWVELSLVNFFGILFYSPSHPPPLGGNLSHCSGFLSRLVGWGNLFFVFSHVLGENRRGWGEVGLGSVSGGGLKFF